MVKKIERNMSAEALMTSTGRAHSGWAQGITVDFEQAVKGRLPGQRPDGTFTVSRTATVRGERLEALASLAASVTARYGEPYGENLAASQSFVGGWTMAPD